MDNRRRRTRVNFSGTVDVQVTGAWLRDLQIRDLSHKGVFLIGDNPFKVGQDCHVVIHLNSEAADAPRLHLDGKVARITKEGTAIDFVAMDADTYVHIRNLVLLNAADPEKAQQEFSQPAFDASLEEEKP